MREIKFRAWLKEWDEKGGKMFYKALPLGGWDRWWVVLDEGDSTYDGEWEAGKEIEVMQFTGLHDKNGKEIYEGDVVRVKTSLSDRTGDVNWNELEGCWRHGDDGSTLGIYIKKFPWIPNCVEIIGNIYENEDLINT